MAEKRYTIQEQLGAGGNGAVFRAYDTQLKRWVAIKRLLSASEAASNDPNSAELRREADTLASLRNANIVTIFDLTMDGDGLFMVMELLEGPDLADAIVHGPLQLDDFKQLAEQTLEALLAAHNLRILHRDIKPENIKVERLPGGRMQAKIIDFGLARTGIAARKQTEDQEGSVMGSIYYMAPEQLSREPTDMRTDLYALGCVFYETLSGRKAFDGKSVNEVIDKHLDHDVVPLGQLCPHLPQWLTFWVMRLMANKPEDRPTSAQQAIEEFRAWEKLPPSPNMMPWMPMGYNYPQQQAYNAPGQMHGYPGGVPAHTTGYYPVPNITSSSVPVQVQPESASVPIGIPAANPNTGPVPGAPQRPVPGPRQPGRPAAAKPKSSGGMTAALMIGGAAVLGIAAFFMLRSGHGGKSATSFSGEFQVGKVREDLYPSDRSFPIPENLRVVHFVSRVASSGYVKDSEGKASKVPSSEITTDSPVAVLNDTTPLGGNTPLVSLEFNPSFSPVRSKWQTPDNIVKDNRLILDFKPRGNNPVAMKLFKPEAHKDDFPFGNLPPAPFKSGLTLAIVFQSDEAGVAARVLRLYAADDKASVTLRVQPSKNLEAEFAGPGGSTTLVSSGIDATKPCIAVIVWDGISSELQLRCRDFRGNLNKTTGKLSAPSGTPLFNLELGSSNRSLAFGGKIAELVVLSTAQREDQIALMDKDMREHYFNAPKLGALNPQTNKQLADWPVGQEREIFNGRDLQNWELNPKWWFVKDGAITNQADPNAQSGGQTVAYWKEGTVGDFELRAKVKLSYGSGGLFYRAMVKGANDTGPTLSGYQADFDSDKSKTSRQGALLETDGRGDLGKTGQKVVIGDHSDSRKANVKGQDNALGDTSQLLEGLNFGQWAELRIVAEGNHLQHYLNNKLVMDAVDEGHGRYKDGVIGLEGSTKGKLIVQYKELKLKRLK